MNERFSRAVGIGTRVTLAINLHLIFGALVAFGVLVFVQGEQWIRVLLFCIGGIALSLVFWFGVPFGLAYAFPPRSDRLEFPGARWIVWPLIALLTLATIVVVMRR